jgi:hypothetical protein
MPVPPRATHRARAALLPLLLLALLAGGLTAQAPVGAKNEKLLAKAEKTLAKREAKLAKLQDKLAAKEAAVPVEEAALDEDQETLALLQDLLAVAQAELDEALAMPEGTPEELALKAEAVEHATLGVKLATKEVALWNKKIGHHQLKLAKLAGQILKLEDKIAKTEGQIDALTVDVAALSAPFDHATAHDWPLQLLVQQAGAVPVAGARVLVVDAQRPPKKKKGLEKTTSGNVYWQGFSDGAGQVSVDVRLPDVLDEVDVIVQAAGLTGPWSEPDLQALGGAFAPSSRAHVAPADLADLSLTFEPELP